MALWVWILCLAATEPHLLGAQNDAGPETVRPASANTVSARDLDAIWSRLWDHFMPGQDFGGLQAEKESGWHRKEHIFGAPFYYVEYGLAQIGALQVLRNSLRDPAKAVADYRAALAAGNTRPLPELFRLAGARFAFDRSTVGELAALIAARLARAGA